MQKYSFYISFPESCLLDVDDCSLDIADENIVLILKKDIPESATGADLWERFHVGLNVNQTIVSPSCILLTSYPQYLGYAIE